TKGGTAGRGHKGAKSRSGYKTKKGHEGGQMPIQRRLPKFGFNNPFRKTYVPLNLSKIQLLAEKYQLTDITIENLRAHKLIGRNDLVKVLGNGELTIKVNVSVHAISESAKQKIEALGGTVTLVE
ncbi:MAG: 50S ribosomal protein L15, partial [Chitinophagales bacterium]|nr:50S ribosomal protein L15 [Chitinophagales bacterium]MDW8273029.1 50S ribosomal protein L15 [Chitinophagales bacterium]